MSSDGRGRLTPVVEKRSTGAAAQAHRQPDVQVRRRIEGVSQKMWTQALRGVERDGLVRRDLHDEMPLRVEYSLTDRGRDLLPLVLALKGWTERHLHAIERDDAVFDARREGELDEVV